MTGKGDWRCTPCAVLEAMRHRDARWRLVPVTTSARRPLPGALRGRHCHDPGLGTRPADVGRAGHAVVYRRRRDPL